MYVSSRSAPWSATTARSSAFVVSLWMNAGFSGAQISTYRSTGISYCASSGSIPSNAPSIILRACSTSASVLDRGPCTTSCPSYSRSRLASSSNDGSK